MAKKNRPCSSYIRLNRDFNTGGKMKNLIFVLSCILVLFMTPIAGLSAENGILAGYGFGLFNKDHSGTNLHGGNYDYIQVAYLHERQLGGRVNWVLEPFVSYINRPDEGLDGGLSLYVKAYLDRERAQGFYATVGVGILYTSEGFREQGTHLLGCLQGGFGYRFGSWFIEDRFKHYSNGRTAHPNRSVHSNVVYFGIYF